MVEAQDKLDLEIIFRVLGERHRGYLNGTVVCAFYGHIAVGKTTAALAFIEGILACKIALGQLVQYPFHRELTVKERRCIFIDREDQDAFEQATATQAKDPNIGVGDIVIIEHPYFKTDSEGYCFSIKKLNANKRLVYLKSCGMQPRMTFL